MPDTLAQRIRAKYPGVYDDLSDVELETKIEARYPGAYNDMPRTKPQGGDTINGRDPNAEPSIIDRLGRMLEPLANPRSGLDLLALGGMSAAPVAKGAAPVLGKGTEMVGKGMESVGDTAERARTALGVGDFIFHRNPAEAVATAMAPTALKIAGKGVQAVGRGLQRTTPLLKFEAPAVEVVKPTEAAIEAAREAAPAIKEAAAELPARLEKLKLTAEEMKQALKWKAKGMPNAAIEQQIRLSRQLTQSTGTTTPEQAAGAIRHRNATGRWD